MSKMVTGQVVFRDAAEVAPTNDGRKLMMIVGVIAVPNDFVFEPEHQYIVSGNPQGQLTVHAESGEDISIMSHGCSLGGLVLQPIWRC